MAAITLVPTGDTRSTLSLCLTCGESGGSGFLLNILLFVPLGALLVQLGVTRVSAALVGFGVSASIELLQAFVVPGRTTALGDLLANGSGALIGALLWHYRVVLLAPRGRSRRLLVSAYAALTASLLWFGRWSSAPWLPEGEWYLQRTPVRAWSDPHSGTLREVAVGSISLPSNRIRDSAVVHHLRNGVATLDLVEVPGPPTRRLAYTVRLVNANQDSELFAMGREGDALVLHRLTNAARLRMSAPSLRTPDVYTDLGGGTVIWSARLTTGGVEMQARPSARTFSMPAPSVFRGWGALLPRARAMTRWQVHALDLLWALVLAVPILGWSVTSWRDRDSARHAHE